MPVVMANAAAKENVSCYVHSTGSPLFVEVILAACNSMLTVSDELKVPPGAAAVFVEVKFVKASASGTLLLNVPPEAGGVFVEVALTEQGFTGHARRRADVDFVSRVGLGDACPSNQGNWKTLLGHMLTRQPRRPDTLQRHADLCPLSRRLDERRPLPADR
jgi:hypothetical protein